jgi:hypothetical protein
MSLQIAHHLLSCCNGSVVPNPACLLALSMCNQNQEFACIFGQGRGSATIRDTDAVVPSGGSGGRGWLLPHMRVRIIDKKLSQVLPPFLCYACTLGCHPAHWSCWDRHAVRLCDRCLVSHRSQGRLYLKKATIVDVPEPTQCAVVVDDLGTHVSVMQQQLETYIPKAPGTRVSRGCCLGTMQSAASNTALFSFGCCLTCFLQVLLFLISHLHPGSFGSDFLRMLDLSPMRSLSCCPCKTYEFSSECCFSAAGHLCQRRAPWAAWEAAGQKFKGAGGCCRAAGGRPDAGGQGSMRRHLPVCGRRRGLSGADNWSCSEPSLLT